MTGTEMLTIVAAMVSCFVLLSIIRRTGFKNTPHESRWETEATPSLGGIGIIVPVLVWLVVDGQHDIARLAGALFFLGLTDDLFGLRADFRFAIHLMVSIFAAQTISSYPTYLELIFAALFIATLINAFNFIDNMDGIAAIAGAFICLCLWTQGSFPAALLWSTLMVFLYFFNRPKAKMWMGDCGSTVLGFLLAVFYLGQVGGKPDWAALWLFSFPLVDITYITIRRLKEGKKPWQGDTNHISHLLARKLGSDQAAFFTVVLWGLLVYIGFMFANRV